MFPSLRPLLFSHQSWEDYYPLPGTATSQASNSFLVIVGSSHIGFTSVSNNHISQDILICPSFRAISLSSSEMGRQPFGLRTRSRLKFGHLDFPSCIRYLELSSHLSHLVTECSMLVTSFVRHSKHYL